MHAVRAALPRRLTGSLVLLASAVSCWLLLAVGWASADDFASYSVSFGEGPLWSVQEVAVAADGGSIVLSDDGQVRRYSVDGRVLDRLYWSPCVDSRLDPLVSIACERDGGVYIGNHTWCTLTRLDQHGGVIKSIGGMGSEPGQFLGITALVLAADGSLYVGDFGNGRVQHFSADLEFLGEWSTPPGDSESHPAGLDALAVDAAGRVWVAWASYYWGGGFYEGRIITYAPDGTQLASFPVEADPADIFQQHSSWFFRDMAFDSAGQLWVLLDGEPDKRELIQFDEFGDRVAAVPLPAETYQFAFSPDGTIVVGGRDFIECRTMPGDTLGRWGDASWAAAREMIAYPGSLAFDQQGRLLVGGGFGGTDPVTGTVSGYLYLHRYTSAGVFDAVLYSAINPTTFERYWALAPDGTIVRSTMPIAIDRDGNRYTLDGSEYLHCKVKKTDASGVLIAEWDLGRNVLKMCLGMDGFLYAWRVTGESITGYGQPCQIEKYDLEGHPLGYWEAFGGELGAVDPAGRVYLGNATFEGIHSVDFHSSTGSLLGTIAAAGEEILSWVSAVALSVDGKMAVADRQSNRVHVFQLARSRFWDVPWLFWAEAEIESAADAGVVQGYPDGSYRPALSVDRAQMAVYLARALAGGDANVPPGPAFPSFRDVPPDHWAFKYVEYLKGRGVVQGFVSGSYWPSLLVDRAQMAVFLARSIGGSYWIAPPPPQPTFEDVTAVGRWAWCYREVEYLVRLGIVKGYPDGKYHPEAVVNRAQMAVFVMRAFPAPAPELVVEHATSVQSGSRAMMPGGLRRLRHQG